MKTMHNRKSNSYELDQSLFKTRTRAVRTNFKFRLDKRLFC